MIRNYLKHDLGKNQVLLTSLHGQWLIVNKEKLIGLDKKISGKLIEKGLILTQENKDRIKKKLFRRYKYIYSGPSSFIMAVTERCNHKCAYCSVQAKNSNSRKYDMSLQTGKAMVDLAFNINTDHLQFEFQGGEPLKNFSFVKSIVKYVNKKNKLEGRKILFVIATNLHEMTDEKLKYLISHKFGIGASLDGPKFLHDYNRKLLDKGTSYDSTSYWLKRVKKFDYYLNPLLTVTRKALPYWKEIVDEYVNFGLDVIQLRHMLPVGYGKEKWDKIGYSAEEFFEFYRNGLEYIFSLNQEGIDIREHLTKFLFAYVTQQKLQHMCNRRPCGAFFSQVSVDRNNNLFMCDVDRARKHSEVNLLKTNYNELRKKYLVKYMMEMLPFDEECVNCAWLPFCRSCVAVNRSVHGTIHKINTKNDFMCKLTKLKLNYLFDIYHNNEEYKKILSKWVETEKFPGGRNRRRPVC